jgi:adenylate kinase
VENLIFVGGIHGAGKGTLCKKICDDLNLKHLSASEVLKWEEISEKEEKLVEDFSFTQIRLIDNLQQIVKEEEKYLLDGHYCLLNYEGKPERIDIETFKLLNPFAFIVVIDEVFEIKKRLEKRDDKEYNFDLLSEFQEKEIEYSKELANQFNIPHLLIRSEEVLKFKFFLSYENFT